MNKIYLTIRKITVAPIMAAVMLTILFIAKSEIFQSAFTYILSLFFFRDSANAGISYAKTYPAI